MIRARSDPLDSLRRLETILGSNLETSVLLGNLYAPANALFSILSKYCVSLALYTGYEGCEISLRGSGTPIRIGNNFVVICTHHQVFSGEISEEFRSIGLLVPGSGNLVTSEGFSASSESALLVTDAFQLCAFDFTGPVLSHPALGVHFFDLSSVPIWDGISDPLLTLSYGLPFENQIFDVYDSRAIHFVTREVKLFDIRKTSDAHLLRGQTSCALPFEPNGMSGEPVFVVCETGGDLKLFVAGIICRGGKNNLHLIGPDALRLFLDWWRVTPATGDHGRQH